MMMKKVFKSTFFGLLIALNLGIAFVLTVPTVNAQNNCACAVCGRPCNEISTSGHAPGNSCYIAPSSSGTSSGGGSGYSPEVQMMQSLLTPIVENFFKWLISGPSPRPSQQTERKVDKKTQEEYDREYKKRQEEYKVMILQQITNAKGEFERKNNSQFGELKESTLNEFKERLAKSVATKAVKQANCAAHSKLLSVKKALADFDDFKDINGEAEKERSLVDFTDGIGDDCPDIKIDIPEVTASQPISFQELLYNYVVHQSDSVKLTIDSLRVKKIKNDEAIVEKKQKVEEVRLVVEKQKLEPKTDVAVNQDKDDQLVKDAMKELETATKELEMAEEEDQKMKEEIALKEKNITALEKMRSTYDTPKKPLNPEPSVTK